MNTKMIEINNEVNRVLTNGLKVAMNLEKKGQKEEADLVLKITSDIATRRIQESGLQEALTEFWNDKKALINQEAI